MGPRMVGLSRMLRMRHANAVCTTTRIVPSGRALIVVHPINRSAPTTMGSTSTVACRSLPKLMAVGRPHQGKPREKGTAGSGFSHEETPVFAL